MIFVYNYVYYFSLIKNNCFSLLRKTFFERFTMIRFTFLTLFCRRVSGHVCYISEYNKSIRHLNRRTKYFHISSSFIPLNYMSTSSRIRNMSTQEVIEIDCRYVFDNSLENLLKENNKLSSLIF